MSDQSAKTQVEEQVEQVAAPVQPDEATTTDKTPQVSDTQAVVENAADKQTTDEPSTKEPVTTDEAEPAEKSEEQPQATKEKNEADANNVEQDGVDSKQSTDGAASVPEAQVADEDDKLVESSNIDDKTIEANGDQKQAEAEPLVEETNGVAKRKAENGADPADDGKSPKKAKVVDDGDKATVEETAA